MANKTYAEKLRDPRWQSRRLEVLNRDSFTCQMCNDATTELHIHHFCYPSSTNPWDSDLDDLITYCKHCHLVVEKSIIHVESIRKINIDSNRVLLIGFPFEATMLFYIYNNKENKITETAELPYSFGQSFILPVDIPQQWICDACGAANFNNTRCRLCQWVVTNKNYQHG